MLARNLVGWAGCPAVLAIVLATEAALRGAGFADVRIVRVLTPAWTTDAITQAGRQKLLDYGIGVSSKHFRALFKSHLYITFLATVPLGVVTAICDAIGQSNATMTLLSGFGGVDSAAPSWEMWELGRVIASSATLCAEFAKGTRGVLHRVDALATSGDADAKAFVAKFDEFLYEFGSRGPNEWEMRSPTWETDPELALASINLMWKAPAADNPQSRWEARSAEREPLLATLTEALAADPATQGQFAAAAAACSKFMPTRERSKTNIIRMLHESRMAFREWGRRMLAAGNFEYIEDFGLLLLDEFKLFVGNPASFKATLTERRDKMALFDSIEPPFILNGETIDYHTWPTKGSRAVVVGKSGDVLSGLAGAPGTYTGRACVIDSPHDPTALELGDVLVAPITDPSWTPLFVAAGAVVVNVGAPASHAVIVSREIGLPCVVSVADATRRIPHGAMITVDGNAGTVTII